MKNMILRRRLTKVQHKIAMVLLWGLGVGTFIFIVLLLFTILKKGLPLITVNFLLGLPEEIDAGGGIGPFLLNSLYILVLSMAFALPIGTAAGIFLAEYAKENKLTSFIRISVDSLASVPSIIFGLVGVVFFVEYFQIGLTILGAGLTLAMLNLPVLTRVTEEAVRAVPQNYREASLALGATKFQSIITVVIPAALPGILTGVNLVACRAFGESAVILLTAGTSSSGMMWDFNLFSPGATLAVHLWYVQSEAIVVDAREIADKSAAVLVFVVLMITFLVKMPLWLKNLKS